MPLRLPRRRLPPAVARALPFAPRERTLAWDECAAGCAVVATTHGLWEWAARRPPQWRCWRDREVPERRRTAGFGGCGHRVDPLSALHDVIRSQDRSSRLVDLGFRLPSGTRLRIEARTCRFDGVVAWRSVLSTSPAPGDEALARALVARARREYGPTGPVG